MSLGPVHVVVNPRAGRGSVKRAWPSVAGILDEANVAYAVTFTEHPGHGTEATRAAIDAGARFIVAVGGDGTVHETVNGMMSGSGPRAAGLTLGVVPSGTGCDFAKTFGLPQDPTDAARHLTGDSLWGMLDIGHVRFRTLGGGEEARWFVNIAEAGIGARVVATAARMPRWLGGRAYRLAALAGILTFRPQRVHLKMNGRKARGLPVGSPLGDVEHEGVVTMVVVANCQFFGAGLRVAPRAIPSDAMLDVLVGEGSKWDAVRALKKMPTGSHVPHETLTEYLVDALEIDGPAPLRVEADGELLGTTPASFSLVREAIALKI